MAGKPLFSVLIANYNNGRYLMDAIESVRAQTYTNWEIIIVDDGSTDNSHELYKLLEQDSCIHIFYNEKNEGCGYTKHRCVELAHGELCGFLDPDDTLTNDALEVMVNEHGCLDDVGLVYSKYYLSGENLNIQGESIHQCKLPEGKSFLEYGRGAISHFATFKKSFYDLTEGINASYKRAIDHDLYFLLEEVGEVRFVDKPLYYYRSNTNNNISTGSNAEAAMLWDLIIMSEACRRRGLDIEDVVLPKLKDYIEGERKESKLKGENLVRQSKAYRVGKSILKPMKKIGLD